MEFLVLPVDCIEVLLASIYFFNFPLGYGPCTILFGVPYKQN